mmetsp:Transcript_29890/g.87254  ORF Transcript_29890/g.87254 Transcript_29890/m.87254 type:complete len:237 (-) Transcript_29890:2042-2752(-)
MVVITSRSTGCSLRRLLLLGICVRLEQGCRLLLLAGLVPGARFSQVPLPCSRSLLSPILLVSSPRIVGQDSSFQHRLHRAVEEEESLLHRSKTIDDKTSASSGMRRLLAATALVVRLVLGVVAEPNGVAVVLALLLEFTGTVFVRAALEVDIGVRQGQRDRVRPGLLNLVDEIIDGTERTYSASCSCRSSRPLLCRVAKETAAATDLKKQRQHFFFETSKKPTHHLFTLIYISLLR